MFVVINPRHVREGFTVFGLCVSVCLSGRDELLCSLTPAGYVVPVPFVDFSNNVRVESYDSKYLSRRS